MAHMFANKDSKILLREYIDLFGTIIRKEKSVVIDRFFEAGYPAFILTILRSLAHNLE
jgi:hypothetical protein